MRWHLTEVLARVSTLLGTLFIHNRWSLCTKAMIRLPISDTWWANVYLQKWQINQTCLHLFHNYLFAIYLVYLPVQMLIKCIYQYKCLWSVSTSTNLSNVSTNTNVYRVYLPIQMFFSSSLSTSTDVYEVYLPLQMFMKCIYQYKWQTLR